MISCWSEKKTIKSKELHTAVATGRGKREEQESLVFVRAANSWFSRCMRFSSGFDFDAPAAG
jgi:hypothetical protein